MFEKDFRFFGIIILIKNTEDTMNKKSIIIVDDSLTLTKDLTDFFSNDKIFEVIAVANDGLDAVSKIEKLNPDYVLLDIVMPELDGFGVLNEVKYRVDKSKTSIIIMSQLVSDGFINKAIKNGADYFLAKPFGFDSLRERLMEFEKGVEVTIMPASNKETIRPPKSSLDEKIANIFISVGIPAHIKGYQFLREAIKMAVDSPEIINSITKKLYPSIAKKFDTTPSKVERAIRHAIEVAWNRGKIENINQIFGIKVYSANEKPTNGEFIALVADKMLIEGA